MAPVDGEPDSSPGAEDTNGVGASPQSTSTQDAPSGESSTLTADDGKPKSTLDIIESVLGEKKPSEGSPPSADPVKDPKSEGQPPTSKSAGEQKPEDKEPPFHTHPRWRELNDKLKEAEADANEYRAITTYAESKGMSIDDVADAIELAAMVRTDPAKAREHVVAILDSIDNFIGEKLPKDLAEAVENGSITEDHAKELSRARAALANSQNAARQRSERAKQERQSADQKAQQDQIRKSVSTAVKAWETETRNSDPDFDQKKDMIKDRIKAIISERGSLPQSAEDGVAIAKQAHADVTARLSKVMPPRKPRATLPAEPGASGSPAEKPKSTLDVINRVIGG